VRIQDWLRERITRMLAWWRAPVTARDRATGAVVGGMAGFWIGALGRIVAGPLPVGFTAVLLWGVAGIAAGAIFGRLRPKAAFVFLLPFAAFGCSPG
jgi:hypothetical protein